MQQAGNPEANPVTYRNLTQNLLLSLHAYDTVYHMDQFRPGPQGHLVPQRVRPPVPRPVRDQVVQQEPPPFLFKRKQVVMYEALEDADAVDGDTEEGDPAGAAPKGVNYRVLGTLPNVMPRRQTLAFYELYRSLKREGKLPAELHNNPYRAMQGFYKHWVSWALTRQKVGLPASQVPSPAITCDRGTGCGMADGVAPLPPLRCAGPPCHRERRGVHKGGGGGGVHRPRSSSQRCLFIGPTGVQPCPLGPPP